MNREKLIKELNELIADEENNVTRAKGNGDNDGVQWSYGYISACKHFVEMLNRKSFSVMLRNENGVDFRYFHDKKEAEDFANRMLRAEYYDTAEVKEIDTY